MRSSRTCSIPKAPRSISSRSPTTSRPARAVNFYTLVEAAADRGETAIGYRLVARANKSDQGFGVVINPDKAEAVTFAAEDKLVVLAEE